jgi:hypothetical protein
MAEGWTVLRPTLLKTSRKGEQSFTTCAMFSLSTRLSLRLRYLPRSNKQLRVCLGHTLTPAAYPRTILGHRNRIGSSCTLSDTTRSSLHISKNKVDEEPNQITGDEPRASGNGLRECVRLSSLARGRSVPAFVATCSCIAHCLAGMIHLTKPCLSQQVFWGSMRSAGRVSRPSRV